MRRLLVALCLLACTVFAQTDRGTITGTVTDPAGAVVAAAPIEARNAETGAVYPTQSSATGNYTLAQLPTGTYQMMVTVPGFKTYVRQNIVVGVAQTVRLDVGLEVGSAAESITVSENVSLLKTESGELSHNVASERLDSLPVLGIGSGQAGSSGVRNPLAVTQLAPGTSWRPNSDVRVNGAPSNTQSIRVEGQESGNSFLTYAQAQVQPSVDAIQELSIQTSNFAAEFGQAGGGIFNFTMKSGTNQFHGSAYDYIANDVLNSGTPWTSLNANEHNRPTVRRNDFGGTVGGPVIIPKIFNGRDRTFFFFSFEQFKEKQGITNQFTTVPTTGYRAGDFSQAWVPGSNVTVAGYGTFQEGTIFDPKTTHAVNGVSVRDPFPGNIIPASRIDPVAAAVQKLVPLPTSTALISNGVYPYLSQRITPIPAFKVDHNLSSKAKVSFYWSRTYTESQYSPTLGQSEGFPTPITATRGTFIYSHVERLNFDYTLAPTLLLHIGVGYQHNDFNDTAPVTDYNALSSLGLKGVTLNRQFPKFDLLCLNASAAGVATNCAGRGGLQSLGPAGQARNVLIKPSANTSVTWVKDNHTYKFGGEVRIEGYPTATLTNVEGYYAFAANPTTGVGIAYPGSAQTGLPINGIGGGKAIGFPYASFLLGLVDNANIQQPTNVRGGKNFLAFFVQDSWKITRRLTMDYGLRWDWGTYVKEQYGRAPSFSPATANPAAGGHPGGSIFEATCNCNFANNYPYAIGPRLGLAYQINPKTVLRAGFGVSYFTASGGALPVSGSTNPYASPTVGEAATTLSQGAAFTPVWPVLSAGLFPINGANGGLTGSPNYIDQNSGRPARQAMWSIGLQREIMRDLVIEASYVGNRGNWWRAGGLVNINAMTADYLKTNFNLDVTNAADRTILLASVGSAAAGRFQNHIPYTGFPLTATVAQSLRPFPQFGTITNFGGANGKTWYDSLQVKATKRLSHGVDFTYTFTYAKELTLGVESDNGGGLTTQPQFNDVFNRGINKYLSGFSQPFRNVLAVNYQTPKPSFTHNKIASYALRDWRIGAVLQYQSGLPILSPRSTGNLNSLLFQSTFVNRVPGVSPFTQDLNCHCFDPNTTFVLNPAAWQDPGSTGVFGSASAYYNDYRQQRRPNESMSFGRFFRFREGKLGMEVRAEFSNIFNRAEMPNPTSTNIAAQQTRNSSGLATAGFGFINTQSALPVTERQGTGVIRFTF